MTKSTKILLGLCGAAAAGVIIGMLVAPDKGAETRKKISQKTDDLTHQMQEMFQNGKQYIADLMDKMEKKPKVG